MSIGQNPTNKTAHPSELLQSFLTDRNMSPTDLANRIKVPPNRITGILHGTRALTAETALCLAHYFGTTPELWLTAQMALDLLRAKDRIGERISLQIRPEAQDG